MTPRPTTPRRPRGLVAILLGLTACLLAGDIAFVAFSLASPLGLATARGEDAPAATVARRFYAAVDATIQSGDAASLGELVDPLYREHPERGDAQSSSRETLIASVLQLRALAPALRIAVTSATTTDGDAFVTVRLQVTGAGQGAFLGLALPDELATGGWGPVEIVRVVHGRVAERWNWPESTARLQPLAVTHLPPTDGTARAVSLMRVTLAPHTELRITNGLATRFVLVESGALTIRIDNPRPGNPVPPPSTSLPVPAAAADTPPGARLLAPHDGQLTLPGNRGTLANDGATLASLLVITRFGAGSGTAASSDMMTAAQADLAAITSIGPGLIDGTLLGVTSLATREAQTLAVGQIIVPPDSSLTWAVPQSSMMIAVDQGQVVLTGDTGLTTGTRADGRPWQQGASPLTAGDAVAIVAAATVRCQTATLPTTVLMLTFSPTNDVGDGG